MPTLGKFTVTPWNQLVCSLVNCIICYSVEILDLCAINEFGDLNWDEAVFDNWIYTQSSKRMKNAKISMQVDLWVRSYFHSLLLDLVSKGL